jgi:drug/metabolite transporter (DMT)-like permease
VLVGYFLGGEALGTRTIMGTLLVLVSVLVITATRAPKPDLSLTKEAEPLGEA